jgi:hypothetical protein
MSWRARASRLHSLIWIPLLRALRKIKASDSKFFAKPIGYFPDITIRGKKAKKKA